MTETTTTSALAARFGDRLVRPGDPAYDAARMPWNLAVDQRPAAIVTPVDAVELRLLLDAARADGLRLSPQASGHGASRSLEGAVLVRTTAFDGVWIDAERSVARIGAGVAWSSVLDALAGTGLVALSGSSAVVSAVPFHLGGGHSWFSRAFGIPASSVRAVELFSAEGRHRWITDDDEPELMWALRGAGGELGIVTAIEIDLHPAPQLTGGRITFDGADLVPVLQAVVRVGRTAPDSLALHAGAVRFPDVDEVPPPLRGRTLVSVEVVDLGDPAATEALLAPVRAAGAVVADSIAPLAIESLASVADEPTAPSPGTGWSVAADLDEAAVAALADAWTSPAGLPIMVMGFRVLGGAQSRTAVRPGIAGPLGATHLVSAHAIAIPGSEPAIASGFQAMADSLDHVAVAGRVATFLAADEPFAAAYGSDAAARVAAVKTAVDPEARFLGNRSAT